MLVTHSWKCFSFIACTYRQTDGIQIFLGICEQFYSSIGTVMAAIRIHKRCKLCLHKIYSYDTAAMKTDNKNSLRFEYERFNKMISKRCCGKYYFTFYNLSFFVLQDISYIPQRHWFWITIKRGIRKDNIVYAQKVGNFKFHFY